MGKKKKEKVDTNEERSMKLTEHFEEQNTTLKKLLTELKRKNELSHKKINRLNN